MGKGWVLESGEVWGRGREGAREEDGVQCKKWDMSLEVYRELKRVLHCVCIHVNMFKVQSVHVRICVTYGCTQLCS